MFTYAFSQAIVIGVFGGAGLVLTQLYSRRGPLIYPVYAAILAALALSLARADSLSFGARFVAAFAGMVASTAIAMAATIMRSARQHRAYVAKGVPMGPGHIPWWAGPLLLTLLVTASAGAAFVSM
jgi:hypothetical protein